jgi:hypothetical protein
LPNITPEEIAEMKKDNPLTRAEREQQDMLDQFLSGQDVEAATPHHH